MLILFFVGLLVEKCMVVWCVVFDVGWLCVVFVFVNYVLVGWIVYGLICDVDKDWVWGEIEVIYLYFVYCG